MSNLKMYENYKATDVDYIEFIPNHWEQTQIKAITRTLVIKNKSKEELLSVYREYGVIPKNSRDDNHNVDGKDLSTYKYVSKNNLVVNKMKAWQGSMGVSDYNGIVSPAYIVCKLTDNIVPKYVHYLLRSKYYIDYYNKISYGVRVGQWDMRYCDFKNLTFFIPTNDEQNKIVNFVEHKEKQINKIIQKEKKLITLWEEKRKRIITNFLTKGLKKNVELKESGIEWIGEIPSDWDVYKIKSFSPVLRGASPRPIDNPAFYDVNGEYSWVRISDVTSSNGNLYTAGDKMSRLGTSKSIKLEPESLFLSICASVGKPCISKIKCCIHDGFVYFPYLNKNLNKFLYYMFSVGECYKGLGKIGTQLNLNTGTVGDIKIPFKDEQTAVEIANHLEKFDIEINKIIKQKQDLINKLEEYKKTLISNAVTGQIDVRNYVINNIEDDVDLDVISGEVANELDEVAYANN